MYKDYMEKATKKILVWMVLLIILIASAGYAIAVNRSVQSKKAGVSYYNSIKENPSHKDKEALRRYCRRMGLNTNYCILVDYSIPSGSPRFFIYDFRKKSVVFSCRCAHGLGGGSTARKPVFSNSVNSKCSSLGKFATVGIGSASFKNSIRLEGLDESNDNAAERGLLIHSAWSVTRHKFLRWMLLNRSCEGCFTITKEGLMKVHELYAKEENTKFLITAYK